MNPIRNQTLVDRTSRLVERGSPAMARAAFYIAQNPEKVVQSSIAAIARWCGTGESTVIRLCQTLGFDGFRPFKLALAQEIERERILHFPRDRESEHAVRDARLSLIASELETTIRGSASRMDTGLVAELARLMREAPRVIAYGVSVSGICAEVLATRLAYRGVIVQVPRSGDLARAAAATLTEKDVAIGISYYGLSVDTVTFLERAASRGSHTFAMTTQATSPLAKAARTILELSVFGAWPKEGSARLLPSVILLTEFIATLIEEEAAKTA